MPKLFRKTDLASVIASPSRWDATLATHGDSPHLLQELTALANTPIGAARMAHIHLIAGRNGHALQLLSKTENHPLVYAFKLTAYANRDDYPPIFASSKWLDAITPSTPLDFEIRARARHALAFALWGVHQLRDAARVAQTAIEDAQLCGMRHFAEICEMLRDDCLALQEETCPETRETQLRERLAFNDCPEEHLEVVIDLVQLMYRQGRYDESAKLSQEVPVGRQGRQMQSMNLIANGRGKEVNWDSLKGSLDHGRLRAVYGLFQLDAEFILAGPEPRDQAPLTRRHVAEWQLSFAWAALQKEQLNRTITHLETPFVHRSEWDLRLVRAVIWLELYTQAPDLVKPHINASAFIAEALTLINKHIAKNSILLKMLPSATPTATTLLLATPTGCPPLEAMARTNLALLNGHGLSINGLTRTHADSMVRLAEGKPCLNLSPEAIRAARYRLRRTLGQARLVRADCVWQAMQRITTSALGEENVLWNQATLEFAKRHALPNKAIT